MRHGGAHGAANWPPFERRSRTRLMCFFNLAVSESWAIGATCAADSFVDRARQVRSSCVIAVSVISSQPWYSS